MKGARLPASTTTAGALAIFDESAPVSIEEMIGEWRGAGLHTAHPMDGLLERYGWYGKAFIDPETVHPLLFSTRGATPVALDPRLMLIEWVWNKRFAHRAIIAALFGAVRPLLQTAKPRARLRMLSHRGVVSATMVYDHLPINDVFRRVDGNTLIGLMDMRGMSAPFFFVLRRER